jgi:hypothetical protein
MSAPFDDRGVGDFERALTGWANRPPRVSARTARARVLDRLPDDNGAISFWRLATAALLVSLLFVASWLSLPPGSRPQLVAANGPVVVQAQANVVVFKLDATTTLYFVMRSDN